MSFPPLNAKRKKRIALVSFLLFGIAVSVTLVLLTLNENINLFYSPTQVNANEAPRGHSFRLGGLVEPGSIQRANDSLTVRFAVTDTAQSVPVTYTGILPDLFRESQGIVAQGKLGEDGVFVADQVLAKHDENYMPPEVASAIETAQGAKAGGKPTGMLTE
ncbi:MAG: cytochrome C biogenesis protein CcmE [Gammaproteobacteria bacterium SG8_47]|nr:MAG: cytochrome C biogenesis protein CcmE [Gammaproteobacteria bacterium SG8_47]